MARRIYVYRKQYTFWIILTVLALILFLWYYFKNSGAAREGEKCPDGRNIPPGGDCGTNVVVKDSAGAIKVTSTTPDANGCITVSKYITNSFPLALGMKGSLVTTLQKNLNKYFTAGLTLDPYFGCKTLNAVIKNLKVREVDMVLYNNSAAWTLTNPPLTLSPNTTQ